MPVDDDLTDLQLTIMAALWERKEATISEVWETMSQRTDVSRKTVATLLYRLEERGMVRHRMRGRDGIYRATSTRRGIVVSRMSSLLGALFGEGVASGGAHLIGPGSTKKGDVQRLLALLRKAERDIKDLE